jgi:hypothetical protein
LGKFANFFYTTELKEKTLVYILYREGRKTSPMTTPPLEEANNI